MCQISQNQRIRVTLANKDATTGTSFVFCMFLSDMKTRDEKKKRVKLGGCMRATQASRV